MNLPQKLVRNDPERYPLLWDTVNRLENNNLLTLLEKLTNILLI